ncbi:hypothetical protein LWI28_017625 [Acer negundo]|uniref:Reverse transcriptase domain-containing protein n=1 Tax=Acer negundo TaxID=4023 RepID=A0AAD5JM75_ACENE|nr:hypothetical protein LWI28_017625 [Acer negundo]
MEPPPIGSLNVDEVISSCNVENVPSLHPTNLTIHDQYNDLSKEKGVDTSNKFAALDADGDSCTDQCNNQCNDVDSPTTASPDHSLWHLKIKNIDGVKIIGLSSPMDSSSKKKKKKMAAKIGKDNSSQAKLDDLRFSGFLHTLCNKRGDGCISKKLDRVLVNNEWLVKFEHLETVFLPPSSSDHCPSVVKLGLPGNKKNYPFKFFNFLTDREDFLPLVKTVWQEQVHGTMQYKLCSKLRILKKALKTFNNDKVGDVSIKSIEAMAALDACQLLLDLHPLDTNLRIREKELINNYTLTLQAEEDLLRQKSRIQWLKAGDILVKNEAIRHFQNILGCTMPTRHGIGTLSNIIDNVISNDQADLMDRDVTNDEIREVCFSLHPNKAPGPDGFNWDIVGEDVINAIQEFFRSGHLLKELNATIISLVPKVPNPSMMKDFRPISYCNTLYKIIAKIIANRIKPCLPDIISPSQSVFVAGRSIGDNILLPQELMRNYHTDIGCPRLALKVDLMKAFDMVDWGFLLETLAAFHFPPRVIKWIKACLTTPKFSISLNGELAGFFSEKKGLL